MSDLHKPLQDDEQLFFMHIAKTAGTSLIAILDQRFTIDEICPLDRATRTQFLSTFTAEERFGFKFIRGHFPYSLKDDLKSPRLITFLRDPVERSLSEISHLKRLEEQGQKYIDESIKDLSLDAFINHPLVGSHVVNRTTKYLNDFKSVITVVVPPEPKPDLNLARERLGTFEFIGITERFEESIELLAYTLGFPPITDYPVLQVSPQREKRQNIPQHILDQLAEMNRDEIELYEYGIKIFEKRLEEMKREKAPGKSYSSAVPHETSVKINFHRVDPGRGWHVGENNPKYGIIRWSGPENASYLRLPQLSAGDYRLRFRIVNAITLDVLESLQLEFNKNVIPLLKQSEDDPDAIIFEGYISQSMLAPGGEENILAFKILRTCRPSELQSPSQDTRQLGLCYNWLQISPVNQEKKTMTKIINRNQYLKQPLNEDEQLFFMHIPKTAGTSLIAVLDQRYTVDEICPLDRGTPEKYLSVQEEDRSRYKFIRGHFPYSLASHLHNPRTLTFLRDPVRRTLSAINHHKRLEEQDLSFFRDIPLAELTLEEFLDHPVLGNFVANKAVQYLNDMTVRRPLGSPPPDLSLAKERLETFDFIGLTERFDDSLKLLAHTFGFPPIQGYQTLQSTPREKREEVPQYLLDRLADMNRDELELYQYGLKLFEKRLGQMKTEQVTAPIETQQRMGEKEIFHNMRRTNPGRGWHVGEPHHVYGVVRWSGPDTVSYLDLPLQVERDLLVRFRVLAAITPEVLQSLKLEVNGNTIKLHQRVDGSHGAIIFEGRIPYSVQKNSESLTTLVFTVSQTHRPGELQAGNTDDRKLGLCYNWLHVYPE